MTYYYSYNAPAYEYAPKGLNPEESLARLKEGNARFMAETLRGERFSAVRRQSLEEGQSPFAVIIGCSDSRVPPEEIFDQGLGELFVIRSAGHLPDAVTLGSIEYGVAYLGAQLVVVLGHQDCGAVCAAMANKEYLGYLRTVVNAVEPGIAKIKKNGGTLQEAVLAHIAYTVKRIGQAKPYLAAMRKLGKIRIVGALYTFHDGKVTFFD